MSVYLTARAYIKIYGILEKDNVDKLLPHEWDFIFDVYAGYIWPAVNGPKKERIKRVEPDHTGIVSCPRCLAVPTFTKYHDYFYCCGATFKNEEDWNEYARDTFNFLERKWDVWTHRVRDGLDWRDDSGNEGAKR